MSMAFLKYSKQKISNSLFIAGLISFFFCLPIFNVFPQKTADSVPNTSNRPKENTQNATQHDAQNPKPNSMVFTPFHFDDVQFPELSPEELKRFHKMKSDWDSENMEKAFPEIREFLLLHAEKFLPKQDERNFVKSTDQINDEIQRLWDSHGKMTSRSPVRVICRNFIQDLPPKYLQDWQNFNLPSLQTALTFISQKIPNMPPENILKILKQIRNQNPCSALDAQILNEIALNALKIGNFNDALFFGTLELSERKKRPDQTTFQSLPYFCPLPEIEELEQNLEQIKKMIATSSPTFSNPGWSVNMTQIRNPKGEIIFEDFLPEEQKSALFLEKNRNREHEEKEIPQFLTFSPDGQFLIARLGTQVTLWPSNQRATRPQAYLVILDLSRDGSLLGIISPDSLSRVLIGNPLADEQFVYVPTLSISENMEIDLDIYALNDGNLVDRKTICSSSMIPSSDSKKYPETIFLPIRWTNRGKILVGGPESGFQVIMEK